jgi:hypothetical protein
VLRPLGWADAFGRLEIVIRPNLQGRAVHII